MQIIEYHPPALHTHTHTHTLGWYTNRNPETFVNKAFVNKDTYQPPHTLGLHRNMTVDTFVNMTPTSLHTVGLN